MLDKNYERKISLLDWGIILSTLLLLLTIYLPQSIWQEEEKLIKKQVGLKTLQFLNFL